MNTKQIIGIVLPILFIISFMTIYRKYILNFSVTYKSPAIKLAQRAIHKSY